MKRAISVEKRLPTGGKFGMLVGFGFLVILMTGCRTKWAMSLPLGPTAAPYVTSNSYVDPRGIPTEVSRIAVLPLVTSAEMEPSTVDIPTMRGLIVEALRESERFEIVTIDAQSIRDWTGVFDWRSTDSMPSNFLDIVQEGTGSDAVFFSELTVFKPYSNVTLGWKCRLVMGEDERTIWAFDEIFDGADKDVQLAVNQYLKDRNDVVLRNNEASFWHKSPRNFARFSLHSMVWTIPER